MTDVVVSDPDGDALALFMMRRAGGVAARSTLPMAGHPKGVALRDLDGDGKADLVVTATAANTVTVGFGR